MTDSSAPAAAHAAAFVEGLTGLMAELVRHVQFAHCGDSLRLLDDTPAVKEQGEVGLDEAALAGAPAGADGGA